MGAWLANIGSALFPPGGGGGSRAVSRFEAAEEPHAGLAQASSTFSGGTNSVWTQLLASTLATGSARCIQAIENAAVQRNSFLVSVPPPKFLPMLSDPV